MSGIRHGSHLEHLLELRDRVDEEISKERTRIAAAEKRRAQLAAEAEREARKEAARAERERRALERLAEVEEIEAAAPADLVRAWARDAGINVGTHGRLPLDLRKQYLDAAGGDS
jgi:small-conductance mechanosensitive channel